MLSVSRGLELVTRGIKNPGKVLPFFDRRVNKILAPRRARKLAGAEHPQVAGIGEALSEAIANRHDADEARWIDTLKELRAEIDSNVKPLQIVDYGAGSPDADRSRKEMQEGIEETRQVNELAKSGYSDCLFLFKLIRQVRPETVLELGTSVGMGAAYQGAALQLNEHGTLTSIEGSDAIADVARSYLASVGVATVTVEVGRFQDVLPGLLDRQEPIDIVYIDGHHNGDATLGYFEQIFPHLSADAILIFDDITWSKDMSRAWEIIKTDERIGTTVNTGGMGVCCTDDYLDNSYQILIE